jgi:putative endonuclease
MLHGYRILARRHRTPAGELDLIALRRKRLAFIEVKYRRTLADGEQALTPRQMTRMHHAAEHWLSRQPALADHEQCFDAVIVRPWAQPVHLPDACRPVGYERM